MQSTLSRSGVPPLPIAVFCMLLLSLSMGTTAQTPITDTLPHAQPAAAHPACLLPFIDPVFSMPLTRITDSAALGNDAAVPVYSEIQAWNADQTLLLLRSGDILDAKTYAKKHSLNFGWPAFGSGPRWSPVDPDVLYYTGGLGAGGTDPDNIQCVTASARLMRYRLVHGATLTAKRELVHCFPEYSELNKNASYQELSEDGRFIALVGQRPDGVSEVFSFDLQTGTKSTPLVCPDAIYQGSTIHRSPDWAGMSPSGKYVLVMWAHGDARYNGLEAYDRATMAYTGKVTCSSGHGDVIMDAQGAEWYVCTNANNAYFLTGNHYIVKSRIPNGVVFTGSGSVDPAATVATGASVPLLKLDWSLGLHCSCRGINSGWKGAYVSIDKSWSAGAPAFTGELFYVDLSSTADRPVVQRLAHHRSAPDYIAGLPDGTCSIESYWMQPHATVSPDGKQIIFGSSWGPTCRAESYVMDLSGIRASANTAHPAPSKTIQGRGIRSNHAQLFDCMGRRIFMRAHETAADFMQHHQGVYIFVSPDGIKRISGIAD